MWQYRDNGRVDGIRGNVDMDIAYKDFARVISEEGLNHLKRPESTPDSATPEPNDVIRYVVKKGDTLSAIAKQHGVTLQRLISYNHITDPDRIYPGEVIDIPHGENVSAMRFYTVKPGDTLSGIAKKHQTTVKKLQQLNKIKDPDQIYPGQIIQIR
jgi:LysM repeat protein